LKSSLVFISDSSDGLVNNLELAAVRNIVTAANQNKESLRDADGRDLELDDLCILVMDARGVLGQDPARTHRERGRPTHKQVCKRERKEANSAEKAF
jgi:hypothetical protein